VNVQPLISLVGTVSATGNIEVLSVMRVEALPTLTGTSTNMIAELIGAKGDVVASAEVVRLQSHGSGCGCWDQSETDQDAHGPYAFQALVSDVEPGTALRIRERPATLGSDLGREALWIREAPQRQPRVQRLTAKLVADRLQLRWTTSGVATRSGLTHTVQVSKDEGVSWNGVAVGLEGEKADLSLDGLPSGKVFIRVLAHDGFFTATAAPKRVTIPARAPVVSILHPADQQPIWAGGIVRLYGAMTSSRGASDEKARAVWRIDGESVAEDLDTFIDAPPPGEYRLELTVEDSDGRASQEVRLLVLGQGEDTRPPERAG
jgi:hypothetical protein